MKNRLLQIRVSQEEKAEIEATAKKEGFNHISAFILWLFRKYGKNQ